VACPNSSNDFGIIDAERAWLVDLAKEYEAIRKQIVVTDEKHGSQEGEVQKEWAETVPGFGNRPDRLACAGCVTRETGWWMQ
jgi:hypothetical protein